jgi:cytochrome c nitrite reductase small subunit
MEQGNKTRSSLGKKLFNKKVLLIIVALAVVVGAGGSLVMVKASDNPAFCSTCHLMKPYYESWHDGNLLAKKHADADVECHDCHESSLSIQIQEGIKFVTGDYKTPLDKREFPEEFCLRCHDDFESVKAKTNLGDSNPHESHIGEQECYMCHSMHQQSEVVCAQCHTFTWVDDLDDSWAK